MRAIASVTTRMLSTFALALTSLFVVVDPLAVTPMFLAMTRGRPRAESHRIAARASLVAGAVLVVFALFGRAILAALGVELSAFRVAGGVLLMLTALDMLRARASECRCTPGELAGRDDVAIVPLAMPLLAGPGAIATVMVLVAEAPGALGAGAVLAAVGVTMLATWVLLRGAVLVERFVSPSVNTLVQRVMGLVLAAVAVQFVVGGGRQLLGL